MANMSRELYPAEAQYGGTFPQFSRALGTVGPVTWLAYDATAVESAFWELGAINYGASLPSVTVDIIWGAATATSGVVVWDVQLAAITPETDTASVEAKAYGTTVSVSDTHLGTTARRLMRATLSLTTTAQLDNMANGDQLWVKITRNGASASDTLAGDALLHSGLVTWSDT